MENRYRRIGAVVVATMALTLGIVAAPAQAADDAVTVGTAGDATYRLVSDGDGTYQLLVDRAGASQWRTTAGAVGLRLQGVTGVTYGDYTDVSQTPSGAVAHADVTTPAGTVLRVEDSYTMADGALRVDRRFAVTALAAADAGRGVSLLYTLRNEEAQAPVHYQWFAPGAWYGNGSGTFLDRTKLAFDGTETAITVDALGAPLFAAYDPDDGDGLTFTDATDGQRDTIAADKDPQYSKTIVDARIDLPGLGLRQVAAGGSHTELVHAYPGATINYRNRYAGKPTVWRFLPLSAALTGDTALTIRLTHAASFTDSVRDTWRTAFEESATVDRSVDTKIHFDTLVDYVDASYGVDQGRRAYYTNYGLHQPSSGFLWRNADTAWVMLAQGWSRQDSGMRDRARNVIADQLAMGGFTSTNPRTLGESHLNLMRAYLEDKAHGVVNPTWLAEVRAYGDGLPQAAPIYASEAMLLLAEETGDNTYRAKVETGALAAWQAGQKDMQFGGSLEDYNGGPAELDREAGYTALEAYMALYRHTSDPAAKADWLAKARVAADFAETWSFVQDIAMMPIDGGSDLLFYGNDQVPAYGLSGIHAGASGGDAYEALNAVDFEELAEATGDEQYRGFAVYVEKNAMLYTNMGDKAGLMADALHDTGLGFGNEYMGTAANDYWNNNQRGDGNSSNIGWFTYVLLAMTQRTLDYTGGRYTLDGSTVSGINGLDAYVQIVNQATGKALDVAGDARTSGTPLVVTAQDSGTDRTQQWLWQPLGDGTVKLVDRSTAKVVSLPDATSGTAAVQATFYPDLRYRFRLVDEGDGWFSIVSADTGNALEVAPTTQSDGLRVQQNVPNHSDYQRWRLQPVGDLQLLDPRQPQALTATGTTIGLTAFDDDATVSQRWTALPADEGYLGLVDRANGLALTADGDARTADQPSNLDFGGFSFAQQWSLQIRDDGDVVWTNRADPAATLTLRLQTAGPPTVDAPASPVATPVTRVVAEEGGNPDLPATLEATMSDGTQRTLAVTWPDSLPATAGWYQLAGDVEGSEQAARMVLLRLPAGGVVSFDEVDATTTAGTAPTLPATVTARGTDGTTVQVPVTWQMPAQDAWAQAGTVTVPGLVTGIAARPVATVVVQPAPDRTPVSVQAVRVTAQAGGLPSLPGEIPVGYDDGTTSPAPVAWQALDASDYSQPGYVTVTGEADGLPVTAYVTVAALVDDFSGDASRWTQGGAATWSITDGALAVPVMASGSSAYAFAEALDGSLLRRSGDVVMEATVTVRQVGNGGLWLRGSGADESNGYYFGIEGHTSSFVVGVVVNGVWTQWAYAAAGTAPGIPHRLKAVLSGTTLSFYADGSLLYTKTDTQLTSGTFGVRSWSAAMVADDVVVRTVPPVVEVTSPGQVVTAAGVAPTLPGSVPSRDAAGEPGTAAVTWSTIDPAAYATGGAFDVAGTAAGLPLSVHVVVNPPATLTDTARPLVLTDPGEQPVLPATVLGTYSDGRTAPVPVTWDPVSVDRLGAPGYVEVSGVVTGTTAVVHAAVGVATFADDFSDGDAGGWTPYAGTWTVDAQHRYGVTLGGWSGSGEKAVANGTSAADLVYEAQVTVTGGNDAGVIFRVTQPSVGADSYRGYYAGISLAQQAVIFGRADGSWTQLASAPGWPGIAAGQPVTVRVVATGRQIQVYVADMGTPAITYTDTSSAAYLTAGAVGVRGYNSSFRVTDVRLATLPPVDEVRDVHLETLQGVAPALPATVAVRRMDGVTSQAAVTWQLDGVEYAPPSITVTGTVAGTDLSAHAVVTVRPAQLTSAVPVDVITATGRAPDLPDTVSGRYSNGELRTLDVARWDATAPARYAEIGQVRVEGDLAVADNPADVRAAVNVIVVDPDVARGPIVGFRTTAATTTVGVVPILPGTVVAVHQNGEETEESVTWDGVDPVRYGAPGAFDLEGTVAGTSVRPVAHVTVTEASGPVEPVSSLALGVPDRLLVSHTAPLGYTVVVTARGTSPQGTVHVYDGTKLVATGVLVADAPRTGSSLRTSRVRLALPPLSRGLHLLSVRYDGSAEVQAGRSLPVPVLAY